MLPSFRYIGLIAFVVDVILPARRSSVDGFTAAIIIGCIRIIPSLRSITTIKLIYISLGREVVPIGIVAVGFVMRVNIGAIAFQVTALIPDIGIGL